MPPMPRTSLQVVAALYVGIGLLVFLIIAFRGPKVRRAFNPNSPAWDAKDNSRNVLFWFIQVFMFGAIGPVIAILLWPIWLLWLVYSTERVQKSLYGGRHVICRSTSNQAMKRTAPLRNNFSMFATNPARGLSLSR